LAIGSTTAWFLVVHAPQGVPLPLTIELPNGGNALVLFSSQGKAEGFLSGPRNFGPSIVDEVSTNQLLGWLRAHSKWRAAEYVALDPPPQRSDGGEMVLDGYPTEELAAWLEEQQKASQPIRDEKADSTPPRLS
jgi:hypothetical protein